MTFHRNLPNQPPPLITVTGDFLRSFSAVTPGWIRAVDAVTTSFTVFRSQLDRGEEDRVSVDVQETNGDVAAHVDDPTGPFNLTRSVLRELGSCGTYVRRFSEKFPLEQYPDGITITEENCARHVDDWDWDWACVRMLNDAGRVEVDRLVRSRSQENRALGTGSARRAAAFGRVFSTQPDMRSPDVLTVRSRAKVLQDQEAISEVVNVRTNVQHREADIVRYEKHIRELRAANERDRERLPELERLAAGPLKRQAEQKHRDAVQTVERMAERLAKAQEAVAATLAEVERFADLETTKALAAPVESVTLVTSNDAVLTDA